MGRTACTEPQCLYKGALYCYLYMEVAPFSQLWYQSPKFCMHILFLIYFVTVLHVLSYFNNHRNIR